MHMIGLNNKIDFTKFDHTSVRQSEIWQNSVRLKAGTFTDLGYRFRENTFDKSDHWIPGVKESDLKFYDSVFFNTDQIGVPDDYPVIAEYWFRVD